MFDTTAPFGFMKRTYRIVLWFGTFTLLGLIEAARLWSAYAYGGSSDVSFVQSLVWALGDYYLWGLLALLIFRMPYLAPLSRERLAVSIPIHVGVAVIVIVAHIVFYTVLFKPLGSLTGAQLGTSLTTFSELLENMLYVRAARSFPIYGGFLAAAFLVAYYRRVNQQQRRLAETQTALARAQTDALKMQLHPHFLFNTLNSIATLVHTDPVTADKMITRLSSLLRATLAASDLPTVPLHQEIEYLKMYLDIQQMRFRDRLVVKWQIGDDVGGLHVPHLILQPIVENAVRHGIASRTEGGTLNISAFRNGRELHLSVRDNGPGIDRSPDSESGIGITNTRNRLRHLYGDHASLTMNSVQPTGLEVRIDIPVEGNDNFK